MRARLRDKAGMIFSVLLAAGLCGCSTVTDIGRGFAGTSTRELERGRKEALTQTFSCDVSGCYDETRQILKNIKAYVYAGDKASEMIACYVSEEDTTPVGIFFVPEASGKTRIEVSSPSTPAKESIARQVFDELGKKEVRVTAMESLMAPKESPAISDVPGAAADK